MDEVCFICCEQGGVRVCRCTTIVHEKCFRLLVEKVKVHEHGCPVCLRPYYTVWTPSVHGMLRTLFFYATAVLWWLLVMTYESRVPTNSTSAPVLSLLMMLTAWCMTFRAAYELGELCKERRVTSAYTQTPDDREIN